MAIGGILHVNVNCSNFEVSREFYELLGFRAYMEFPSYASPSVCRAMAIDPILSRGALMRHENQEGPVYLDLLEWSSGLSPANQDLRAPGIARIALWADDFTGEIERLSSSGVKFIAPPQAVEELDGQRFVFFHDPDGAVIELVERTKGRSATN